MEQIKTPEQTYQEGYNKAIADLKEKFAPQVPFAVLEKEKTELEAALITEGEVLEVLKAELACLFDYDTDAYTGNTGVAELLKARIQFQTEIVVALARQINSKFYWDGIYTDRKYVK